MSRNNLYVIYFNNGTKQLVEGQTIFDAIRKDAIDSKLVNFFSDVASEDWVAKDGVWVREPDPEFRKMVNSFREQRRENRRQFDQQEEEVA